MELNKIGEQLNIFGSCKKYGLPIWQCPHFLFLIMGIIIIITSLAIYSIGNRYITDPLAVAMIVLSVTAILLIIAVIITKSFERLAEANRMKSEFVSIVSHQLKAPLSNLKWAIELLTSGRTNGVSEKQSEYFKILKENSTRMNNLISDLLIVSRIEASRLLLEKKEFFLTSLIEKSIEDIKPFATASNVEIKFLQGKNLPKVFADTSQIRLVIENLLDNAIRYICPFKNNISDKIKEKGKIEIKLEKIDKHCLLEIKDNGIGISKDNQKRIFQKFFRSKKIIECQTQGSGLGLYIAKSIIEKSGGKIGFKSQEGIGSTFWFTLPC